MWLHDESESGEHGKRFLQFVVDRIAAGLTFGGNSARGIGLAEIDGVATLRRYELSSIEDHARYLDDHRKWRMDNNDVPNGGTPVEPRESVQNVAKITLTLGIPRGQDLLVGDGKGVHHEIEPQRVVGVDGKTYWRVPGSTFRGAFKSWVSRLAARDGIDIADSFSKRQEEPSDSNALTGANLGLSLIHI